MRDSNKDVFPGASRKPNGKDNDCDGLIDQVPQTITFLPLPDKKSDDEPFLLTASASSALPIVYSSSNLQVVTISNSLVTIKGAGTTQITASQPGNEYYLPAENVIQNIAVTLVPLITDVVESKIETFRVYPNPAKDKIEIKGIMANDNPLMRIMDFLGREITVKHIEGELNSIDLSDLKEGIYILQIQSKNLGTLQLRLVKQ